MPDRTVNYGAPPDAVYRSRDTDEVDGGGNFVVAEDTDAGTVLLEWDATVGEWVSRGPANLDGNDVTNVGALDASSTETGELSGTYPGNVRGIAAGEVITSIDPATSSTPVQDAYDAVSGSSTGSGSVLLPAGPLDEDGPISLAQGVDILGWGAIPEFNEGSDINITSTGVAGIEVTDTSVSNLVIDGFNLYGPGETENTGPAIHLSSGGGHASLNIGTDRGVRVDHWGNSMFKVDSGTNHYASNCGLIETGGSVDPTQASATAVFHDNSAHPANSWDVIRFFPSNDIDGIVTTGDLVVDVVNIGGATRQAVREEGANVEIGVIEYEPTSRSDHDFQVIRLTSNSKFELGSLVYDPRDGEVNEYAYRLVGPSGKNKLPKPVELTSFGNNILDVFDAPDDVTIFDGHSNDVDNTAGSTTELVRCLEDFGSAG